MTSLSNSLLHHLRRPQTSKCKSLLITSTAPILDNSRIGNHDVDDSFLTPYQKQIKHQIEKTKFHIGIQHNIPVIQSTITSAYPTQDAILATVELAKRSGATGRIIGVGSRGAVDLAKAVTLALNNDSESDDIKENNVVQETLLIPTTLGAVMASTMNDCLVYNVHEEGLCPPSGLNLPIFSSSQIHASSRSAKTAVIPKNKKLNSDIVVDDAGTENEGQNKNYTKENIGKKSSNPEKHKKGIEQQQSPTLQDAAFATLAICIDTAVALNNSTSSGEDDLKYKKLLQDATSNCISALTNPLVGEKEAMDKNLLQQQLSVINALVQAGKLLNLQIDSVNQRRSTPLAIASALIPPYCPGVNLLTFMASLLPGMSQVYSESDSDIEIIQRVQRLLEMENNVSSPPLLSSQLETKNSPDIQSMLETIDGNLILWENYSDETEDILEEILHNSFNRK